jgi:rhamnosyltransferase
MKPKIAAYITLYEDEQAARKCLQAIKSQTVSVDCIFIIDNSQIQLLNDLDDSSILLHHFPGNIGISQGIILALKWAIQEDYNFLWTFDQDSIPSLNCLSMLLKSYQELTEKTGHKIGVIAPTAYDERSKLVIGGVNFHKDKFVHCQHDSSISYYECDAPITSGSLINLNAAKITELPLADLFIDGVDFDYGLKLKQQGFKNFVITNAKLEHNYANPIFINFFGVKKVISSYSHLRYYYSCRNTTYLVLEYAQGLYKLTASFKRIKTTILKIIAILLFEKYNKIQKIYACLLGTYHGCMRKLGKTWS